MFIKLNYRLLTIYFLGLVFGFALDRALLFAGEPKQILTRGHFEVHHNDRNYANDISWKAEGHYKSIIMHLGVNDFRPWEGKEKCPIYIYDTKDDYIKYTNAPIWSGGLASMEPFRLSIYKGSPDLETKTLPHEITHLVLFELFKKPPPLWLNEGLAQFEEEKAGRHFYKKPLKELIAKGAYLKINELFEVKYLLNDDKFIAVFYLESCSVVEFLITQNLGGLFGKFIQELKNGKSSNEALKTVYQWKFKNGASDLEMAWLNYVKTRY